MLNLITQDERRKVAVDNYHVEDGTETAAGTCKIYGEINGEAVGELAAYKKLDDAVKVFWYMALAEAHNTFIVLPGDNPKEIADIDAVMAESFGALLGKKKSK